MRVVGLGGSLRELSLSRAALRTSLEIAAAQGLETDLLDLRALDLPMYIPKIGMDDYPAAHQPGIRRLVEACSQADAMIWSSPTYHGTVSGVFKNALDFLEFLSGHTRPYLSGCPIGLLTVNDQISFSTMINVVHELRGWVAPTQIVVRRPLFTPDLVLEDERTLRRMQRQVDELAAFAAPR